MNLILKNTLLAIGALALPITHIAVCSDSVAENSSIAAYEHISKDSNKDSITYRPLDFTNAHEVHEVFNLFTDQEMLEVAHSTKDEAKAFLDLIRPGKKFDNWKVYIAQNTQGKICGCMAYVMGNGNAATAGNNEANINLLVVTHDYRRQKVATGLLQKLQDDYPHITALKTYIRDYSDAAKASAMHFFTQSGFIEFEKNRGMEKLLGVRQDQPSLQANSKIEIKVVDKNDAKEIQSLADLFSDQEIQEKTHSTKAEMIANAQGVDDLVYIAKAADGTVYGALMAVIDGESAATSSKMIICTVATHPQYRGQGIATQLLQKIEAVCLSRNLQRLELWVIADNEKAIRCYQKAGFTEFANSIGLIKKIK